MGINIFKTVDELIKAFADHFIGIAQSYISSQGKFNVVLSGGSSPELLYKMLASPTYKNQINWDNVNFFFGDERYVPADDPQSNAKMVRKALFDPLNISKANIFFINTTLSPVEAAKDYTNKIETHFKGNNIQFDLVLLGLGDNAHTASLLPYTQILMDKSISVQPVFLEKQNIYRLTMTAAMINQAKHIAFLIYGQVKAKAVHHVLEDKYNPEKYPAQLIKSEQSDIQLYLDEAASSLIKR
jgi:6-phosphogluconolactonase